MAVALVAWLGSGLAACSLLESFDGYTGGGGAADVAIDVTTDVAGDAPPGPGDGGDGGGAGDGSPMDGVVDAPPSPVVGHLAVFGGMAPPTPDASALGQPDASTTPTAVLIAPIHADGTLGAWSPSTPLPANDAVWAAAGVVGNAHLYLIGGGNPTETQSYDHVIAAAIDDAGGVGPWAPTTPLPLSRGAAPAAFSAGYLYVVGGDNISQGQGPLGDTLSAAIAADGAAGTWNASQSLPTPLFVPAIASDQGWLYVTGGAGPASSYAYGTSAVISADTSGGVISTWSSQPSFKSGRYAHASIAHAVAGGHYLYVLGGTTAVATADASIGVFLGDVQFAPIHGDNTIGAWQYTQSLPSKTFGLCVAAFGDYLYIIGGDDETHTLADVSSAHIRGDGSLDPFTAAPPLPEPRVLPSCVAY